MVAFKGPNAKFLLTSNCRRYVLKTLLMMDTTYDNYDFMVTRKFSRLSKGKIVEYICAGDGFVARLKLRSRRAAHMAKASRRWRVRVSFLRGFLPLSSLECKIFKERLRTSLWFYLGRVPYPSLRGMARAVGNARRAKQIRCREPSCIKRDLDGKIDLKEVRGSFPPVPKVSRTLVGSIAMVANKALSWRRWLMGNGVKPGLIGIVASRLHNRSNSHLAFLQKKARRRLVTSRRHWVLAHESFLLDFERYIQCGELSVMSPLVSAGGLGDSLNKGPRVPLFGHVCYCGKPLPLGLLTGRRYCSESCFELQTARVIEAFGKTRDVSMEDVAAATLFAAGGRRYHFGGIFNIRRFG